MTINNSNTINANPLLFGDDVNNNKLINVQTGLSEITGNLSSTTGNGLIVISNQGTLQLDKGAAGNTINFGDSTGELVIEQLGGFARTVVITGLQAGDQIVIPNVPAGFKEVYNSGKVVISSGLTTLGTIAFGGVPPSASVVQNALIICFASGTRIATPDGERPVETLKVGDRVTLHEGGSGEIEWTGYRHIDCERHPNSEKVRPFRIAADAFGAGVPSRDLVLSPDHAVFVDRVLIPVKYLDNGTTIRQLDVRDVIYYHIELREHAIIQAEGLDVESLLPGSDKTRFSPGDGIIRLYPDFSTEHWDGAGCAELVIHGPRLDAVRQGLACRARELNRQSDRVTRRGA